MLAFLLALAFGALVFYTDDYVIAGVLPEISEDLGVTIGEAGQLVTVFSLTVAIAAPVAAVASSQFRRRDVLIAAGLVFVLANGLASITPSFTLLLVLRVAAALAAATATPRSDASFLATRATFARSIQVFGRLLPPPVTLLAMNGLTQFRIRPPSRHYPECVRAMTSYAASTLH